MTKPSQDSFRARDLEDMVARESESWLDCRYAVVSDLHLGSRYCQHEPFVAFLDRLPESTVLVLNGDVVDRIHGGLPSADAAVVDRLRAESHIRPVYWIYGNHDSGYKLDTPGAIRFVDEMTIGRQLYLAHGHGFDTVMPAHRWFVKGFRFLHHLRVACGAEAVHVAAYAKRWDRLYMFLRQHVRRNAALYAKRAGCGAVSCGHTHFPEDQVMDGIRYINTGSWTETPIYFLAVGATALRLTLVEGSGHDSGCQEPDSCRIIKPIP